MNFIRSVLFLIFYISECLASALPWQLASCYNDEYLIKSISDTIFESKKNFSCDCQSRSNSVEDSNNVVILNYKNTFQIFKIDQENRIIDRKIFVKNILSKNLPSKISKWISQMKNISLHFCFIDKKADLKFINKVINNCKLSLRRHFIRDNICPDFEKREIINLTLTGSEGCDCFKNQLIKDLCTRLNYKILGNLPNPTSLKRFVKEMVRKSKKSDFQDVKEFFVEFNRKFADTKFFWNLLKHLFLDKEFGPYFIFFLDTSVYKDNKLNIHSIEQMCKKIKTGLYSDLKEDDREEWRKFACKSFYELIFEVANPKKHELIEHLVSNDLINEKNELIELIQEDIRKRVGFHLKIVQMILETKNELKRKFYESEVNYNQNCIENIRDMLFNKADNSSFVISLELKNNRN